MAPDIRRFQALLAPSSSGTWADDLTEVLAPWPVDLHRPSSDNAAIGLMSAIQLDLAVIEDAFPPPGGLELLRRIRRLDGRLPCFLVSREPDDRMLKEALFLQAYSVVRTQCVSDVIVPMVLGLIRQSSKGGDVSDRFGGSFTARWAGEGDRRDTGSAMN